MQINMLDAKNKLSSLVVAVEQGEEVILARDGVPVAKIVKYVRPKVKPPGAWKGLVEISTDWDSPETNAIVEDLFYTKERLPLEAAAHEPVAQYGRRRNRAPKKPAS